MRKIFAPIVLAVALMGCGNSSPAVSPQAPARAAVALLAQSWIFLAKACIAMVEASPDQATGAIIGAKCEAALDPAHDAIVAAGDAADAWTSASQGQFACSIAQGASGIAAIVPMLPPASVPPAITSALALAAMYGASCVDGGAK